MFIATANLLEPIPPPLRDRMEVIQLPATPKEEKLEIAKRYLVPKQLEDARAEREMRSRFTDGDRARSSGLYPRGGRPESGARDRERRAQGRAQDRRGPQGKTVVDLKKLEQYLGPPRFEYGERRPRTRSASRRASS